MALPNGPIKFRAHIFLGHERVTSTGCIEKVQIDKSFKINAKSVYSTTDFIYGHWFGLRIAVYENFFNETPRGVGNE